MDGWCDKEKEIGTLIHTNSFLESALSFTSYEIRDESFTLSNLRFLGCIQQRIHNTHPV